MNTGDDEIMVGMVDDGDGGGGYGDDGSEHLGTPTRS